MTRVRGHGADSFELDMALVMGPTNWDGGADFTHEDLERGWSIHGARLMDRKRSGTRPWGWWVFEAQEDPPSMEPGAEEIRLAELGELTDEELAGLEEDANVCRPRIGTPAEHYGPNFFPDRRAVELWERIEEIRGK